MDILIMLIMIIKVLDLMPDSYLYLVKIVFYKIDVVIKLENYKELNVFDI